MNSNANAAKTQEIILRFLMRKGKKLSRIKADETRTVLIFCLSRKKGHRHEKMNHKEENLCRKYGNFLRNGYNI